MCEDTVTLWQRRCTLESHSWACTAMIQPTVTGVSPHAAQVSKVAATSTAPHTVKDTQHTSQFAQSTMETHSTMHKSSREVGEGGRPLGGVERLRWLLAEPPEKAFRLNYLSIHLGKMVMDQWWLSSAGGEWTPLKKDWGLNANVLMRGFQEERSSACLAIMKSPPQHSLSLILRIIQFWHPEHLQQRVTCVLWKISVGKEVICTPAPSADYKWIEAPLFRFNEYL